VVVEVVRASLVCECYPKEYTKNRPRFIRCQTCYIGKPVQIGFTARQAVRLTGVPYSTLNLWAKNALVQPSVAPGTGTGSERVYSFSDLVALKVAFELRKSGVTTSSIKKVVEFLRQNADMDKPLSEARLVVSGNDVAIVREGELVSVLSKPGQGYLRFVVDLPQMLGELVNVADAAKAFAHGIASASGAAEARKMQPKSVRGNQRKRARS
jgi:DNA-binding transcriptional MerR regulator